MNDEEQNIQQVDHHEAGYMIAQLQLPLMNQRFAETIKRMSDVLPALAVVDQRMLFAAYLAGRMDAGCEFAQQLGIQGDAAACMVTKTVMAAAAQTGRTEEDIARSIAANEGDEHVH